MSRRFEGALPEIRVACRGRRLGPYHLVAPLARGLQAEVWKAVRHEPVFEAVAVKLLSPVHSRDPVRLARFHDEAERGARMAHAALLPTYEFGVDQGIAYLVTPLVEGFALSDVLLQRCRCRAGLAPRAVHYLAALPERPYRRAVAGILATIARALDAAHAEEVAHRDVKPASILLDRQREDRVFLVDFSLSCDLDTVTVTNASWGSTEGTLWYLAPEKLLGDEVDEVSCDLFSLGATLFEALTLTPPRVLPAGLSRAVWTTYLAGLDLPRPRAVCPDLPAGLEAIVTRATARDPEQRYPSAAALAADLEHFHEGAEPAAAAVTHRIAQKSRGCRR
jgi:serine/threonine-protein kinase